MKSAIALAAALFATAAASPAFAQDGSAAAAETPAATERAPAEAPAEASADAETPPAAAPAAVPAAAVDATAPVAKYGSVGVQLELIPTGSLNFKAQSQEDSVDIDTTFAISAHLAYDVSPNFSLGAAPRIVFGLKGEDGTSSAKELDLRARAALHTPVSPTVQLYGFAEPGFAMIFLPEDAQLDDPSGFVVAFGGGATIDVSPEAFVTAELGYQLGFEGTTFQGVDVDLGADMFHIGVGAGTRF